MKFVWLWLIISLIIQGGASWSSSLDYCLKFNTHDYNYSKSSKSSIIWIFQRRFFNWVSEHIFFIFLSYAHFLRARHSSLFKKCNDFLWVFLFLAKYLANFDPLSKNFHNRTDTYDLIGHSVPAWPQYGQGEMRSSVHTLRSSWITIPFRLSPSLT